MEPSATGKPRLEPELAARLLRFDGAALFGGAPGPSLSYRNCAICSASHAVSPSQRQNGRVGTQFWLWGVRRCQVQRFLEILEERGGGSKPGMACGAALEPDPVWQVAGQAPIFAGRRGASSGCAPPGIPAPCPCHQSLSCFPVPRFAPDSSSDRLELRTTKRGCTDLEFTTWSLSALKRSTSLSPPLPVPPLQSNPTPSPPQPSPALPS